MREFLHLLYAVRPGVPFVFYADHDVAGFHIYLTLKYGSRKSAWAAPSMTCPTLQWGGPSKEQVFQHVRHYAYNQYTAIIRQKNPQWSTEKLTCTANDWLADRVPRLEKEMKKPLKTGSKKLLNTIKQNRYLQYETVEFQDALRLIAQGKGVSHIVCYYHKIADSISCLELWAWQSQQICKHVSRQGRVCRGGLQSTHWYLLSASLGYHPRGN